MANEISLYYSSGSQVEQTYSGQPRKSVGGIITSIKVPQNINALFGKISLKMLNEGSEDYRMVFLKNDGLEGIIGEASTGSITVVNNAITALDVLTIGGEIFTEGTEWITGATSVDTATNIANAINLNGTLFPLITATPNGNVVDLLAKTVGTAGDAITIVYTDSGSGISIVLSGANLTGGVDTILNADISLLNIYVDVPSVAVVQDPADLVPSPVSGDRWIVPQGAKGLWLKQNSVDNSINEYEGKIATYNGSGWTFSFSSFSLFEFGFQAPIDIAIGDKDETILEESFVAPIENVFEPPYGVEFLDADTEPNKLQIGDGNLLIAKKIGVWIKRTVKPFSINGFDLITDEGGIVKDEITPIVFTYDTP